MVPFSDGPFSPPQVEEGSRLVAFILDPKTQTSSQSDLRSNPEGMYQEGPTSPRTYNV